MDGMVIPIEKVWELQDLEAIVEGMIVEIGEREKCFMKNTKKVIVKQYLKIRDKTAQVDLVFYGKNYFSEKFRLSKMGCACVTNWLLDKW